MDQDLLPRNGGDVQAAHLRFAIVLLGATLTQSAPAQNCGWSRVDHHRVNYDASGIWNTNVYRGIVRAASVAQIGGALWEGAESRFGQNNVARHRFDDHRRGGGDGGPAHL